MGSSIFRNAVIRRLKPAATFLICTFYFLLLTSYIVPAFAQEPPALLDRGIQLLNEKNPDEALRAFEEAITRDPKDPLPHYYAGVVYHLKGDLRSALNALNEALNLEPGMPPALLRIGIILEKMGRLDMASDAYRSLAEREEETPQVLEARERFKQITVTLHYRKAGQFFQEKRYEESLKELESVILLTPENAEAYLARGTAYQRLRRPKEAIESFKKATEIEPGNINAHMQLAMTYELLAAYKEAIDAFKKVMSLAPETPQAREAEERVLEDEKRLGARGHFEASADFIRKEQWSEALVETKAILFAEPTNPNALFNLGLIHYKLKEEDAAIEALKQAIEIDPKLQKGYYQLAVVFDDAGQYREAVRTYEKVIAVDDKSEEASKARKRIELLKDIVEAEEKVLGARELVKKEDIAGAIREVEGLLTIKHDDPMLFFTAAILYQRSGRPADAASALEKAIILSPKDQKIRFLLARLYEGLKEYGKAIDAYKAVESIDKDSSMGKEAHSKLPKLTLDLHFVKGRRLLMAGDYEASLQEIKAILEISPDEPLALFNAGVLYDRLNRPQEAEGPLKRATTLVPDYLPAHFQLGVVLEKLRKFDEARRAYEKVIEIQGEGRESGAARTRLTQLKEYEDLTVHLDLGIKYMEMKEWEKARKEVESIIASNPNNYIGYFYLGIILDRANIVDEAKAAFKKAIEINPEFLQTYLRLGDLLSREGELEEARKNYQQIVDLGKDAPEADVAAVRLKALRNWGGTLSVRHGYNSNIAFRAKALATSQSSYNIGLTYFLVRQEAWNLSASFSANETVYYESQNQGNSLSLQVNGIRQFSGNRTLSGGGTYSTSYFEQEPTYVNTTLSANASTEPRTIPTSASLSYTISKGISLVNKTSSSVQQSISVSLSQKLSVRDNVSGSYSFSIYNNLDPIASNYANRTHSISVGYSRPLFSLIGVNLGYSISFVNYSNPDSTTHFQRFRRNVNQGLSGGLSISKSEWVSVSLNYGFSYGISRTNLSPLTSEEAQKLEELLATPIPTVGGGGGSYQHNVGLSLSTTF